LARGARFSRLNRAEHAFRTNFVGFPDVKTVPFVPPSHPFVERVIGTLRREYLDHLFFWNEADLERKLLCYRYNHHRCHTGLNGETPDGYGTKKAVLHKMLETYRWLSHCHGMFQLPVAP